MRLSCQSELSHININNFLLIRKLTFILCFFVDGKTGEDKTIALNISRVLNKLLTNYNKNIRPQYGSGIFILL